MTGKRRKSGRRAVAPRRKPKSTATARARPRRKGAPKAAAKARKRPARKVAKRAPRKRPAAKTTRKRLAPKRAAKRSSPRPATKRVARRRPDAKIRKRAPRKLTAKRAVVSAFPQRAGAWSKQEVLFGLVRARVAVHASVQGLESGGVTEPVAAGKWSVWEHALHLIHWDHEVTQAMEGALRGIAPPWAWAGLDSAAAARFNAEGVESLRHLSWEETRRALLTTRLTLLEEIEAVPDEPGEVWSAKHPFGAMLRDVAENDRHHAETIKRWRGTRGA